MSLSVLDWLRGAGDYSVAVPPMDGTLKPNDRLDLAKLVNEHREPDNLVFHGGKAWFTSGNRLLEVEPDADSSLMEFPQEITCIASDGNEALAIGLEGGLRIEGGRHHGRSFNRLAGLNLECLTSCCFEDSDTLLVTLGSSHHPLRHWKRDLLERGSSGKVLRVRLTDGTFETLVTGLAFPSGIAVNPQKSVLVSESWRHRILKLQGKEISVVVDDLPAYPGRITEASDGGWWLCCFAPRRQLIEFILREKRFVRRMISEVPERHWMAPSLSSGHDFLEPLQGGQIRHHGVLKAWAPTKSYGLVLKLSADYRIRQSEHSRAGGVRHGITSALECANRLLLTSRGGHQVISLSVERTSHGK